MKFRHTFTALAIIISCFLTTHISAQTSCAGAQPFCTGSSVTFSASTNTTSQTGPNYGCLFSQPNPAWYFMQVANSGNIIIDIAGSSGYDVDFICWGPFANLTNVCNNLTAGNTVGCSYSSSATETCTINNAIAGQFYLLLITNFSNQNQNIDFSSSPSSTGSTNCGILSAANSQTICPGASATVSVSTTIGSPTFTWNPGNYNTQSITVSPTGTTIYTVTIAGTNTTNATYTTDVQTSTVTVVSLPTVAVSNTGPYCPGSTGVLTATTNGVSSYTWTGPGGYSATTTVGSSNIPNIQPSASGVYTVMVQNTYSCTNTGTTTVSVTPVSTIAVVPTTSICQGGSFTLTANAAGATLYNWAGPNGYRAPNSQNIVINNGLPSQSGTYTVTAVFGNGSYTCTTRNTSTVTVIPSVTLALSPIPTVCNNGNINLQAPPGGDTYSWAGPAGFQSALQNPVISNAGTINQGIYTLNITTNNCTNSGTVSVSVYNALGITAISAGTVICNRQSTPLSASGSGGSGIYGYSWSPAMGLDNPYSANPVASPGATQVYTFTLSDVNCTVTPSPTAAVTVTVNPLPTITFTTPVNEGCEPFLTPIDAQSTPASVNCVWKFSRNLNANGCNLANMLFPVHGVYNASLTVTDVNGCVDSVSQNAFITVDPKPIADFDWFPGTPTILTNEVTFTDQSTIGTPMKRWRWAFGDPFSSIENDSTGHQNPMHTYSEVGTYSINLSVVNQYGCLDSVTKVLSVEDEFALYIPNAFTPSRADGVNDLFQVKGMGFSSDSFEMRIYDRWGEQIYVTKDINKGWDGSVKGGIRAKQDVYVYRIVVKDFRLKEKIFTGHVTLL